MRIRIIFRPQERIPEGALFGDVFVPRHSTWLPVFASAAAHGLALALLPALVQALAGYDAPPEHKTYHLEMLHLQVPERIFLPSARHEAEHQAKADNQAPAQPAPAHNQAAAGGAQPRPASPGRQMELPVTRQASEKAPVILQPDTALPQAPSVPPAPNLAFWNKVLQPPPPRKQAVIPGRVQASSRPPSLDAPPVLSPSNSQTVTSDVAAMLAATQTAPKLPLPNSSTNPIRMQGKGGNEIASFEMPQSDAVNLIYLMADKPVPKQIEIPKGLQNAPRSRAGAGTEGPTPGSGTLGAAERPNPSATGSAAGNRQSAATDSPPAPGPTAPGPSARTTTAAANSSAPAVHDSAAEAAAAAAARAKTSAASANPAASNPTATASARPTSSEPGRPPEPPANNEPGVIRMNHPVNGNFDVVILQSPSRDELPEVGATLSGNPVYTVYLNVGDKKEWLLEYCVPANSNQHAGAYQVNIDDTGVVAAPYPVATAIPGKVLDLQHAKHIVLHAILSVAGAFRNITSPDMEDPLVREVLPLLSQWKFRPALRDKVPVEVEVLLIIPARS